jgi:hypothetical protein
LNILIQVRVGRIRNGDFFQESEHDKDDSFEESKIDGDLNNLLNQIKEGNQLEGPFSPPTSTSKEKGASAGSGNDTFDISRCSRHWQYLYHFPLPQDDSSVHDCNQVRSLSLHQTIFCYDEFYICLFISIWVRLSYKG